MNTKRDSSELMQDEFGLKLVSLLTANANKHFENGDLPWKEMAKEMGKSFSKKIVRWKKLRQYFERQVLLQLGNFVNDQQIIDRLQYAYLEKVHNIRLRYQRVGPKLTDSSIVARNKLLVKYAINDRYDAEVVSVFKRLHNKRHLRKININVMDPVYGLTPLLQKFLLKPLCQRKRERRQKCFSTKFGTLPVYLQTDVAMEQSNNRACVEASTSAILFDDASSRIEDASLPNPSSTEFSPRDLLEKESLTIPTQEFHRMQLEYSAVAGENGTNSAERNTTPDRTAPASSPHIIISSLSEDEQADESDAMSLIEDSIVDITEEYTSESVDELQTRTNEEATRKGSESGNTSSDNSALTVIFRPQYNKSRISHSTLASTSTHKRVAAFPGTIGTTKRAKTVSAPHTTMDQKANRNQSVGAEMNVDECVPNVPACGLTITCFNSGGCNHEAGLPNVAVKQEYEPLYHLVPDSIFDSTDDEEEAGKSGNVTSSPNSSKAKHHPEVKVEDTTDLCLSNHSAPAGGTCNNEAGLPSVAVEQEYEPLYHLVPDSIFDSTDDEEEVGKSDNGRPSPNLPEINRGSEMVPDNTDVCQTVCSVPADETVPVRTGLENSPELPCSERIVSASSEQEQDLNSRIPCNNVALQEEIVQPNANASTLLGMDTEPVALAKCSTELTEALAAPATLLPVISIGRLSVERIAQIQSKLSQMLTAKIKIYQTLRIMVPKLFFRPFSTDHCLTLSNRLTIMQLLATSMNLVYGQPEHLLPILYRIEYGGFHDIR